WSEEAKFARWFKVEVAFLKAMLENEDKDNGALLDRLEAFQKRVNWEQFTKKVSMHEQKTRHDVIAFLMSLEDELGDDARLIHRGLTSSDIVDTAFALALKDASEAIKKELTALIQALWQQAKNTRGVMMLGRTHGQAAEPLTFGQKLLG